MEQSIMPNDVRALEEWYAAYLSQKDPIATENSTYTETLDPQAIETVTLAHMGDVHVIDGFCSTCKMLLDDWPDVRPTIVAEESTGKTAEHIEPTKSSPKINARSWTQDERHFRACVLPYYGHTARIDAAHRKGCRLCGLVLQAIKDRQWLSMFRKIEKRLQRLRQYSYIPLVITQSDHQYLDNVRLGLPGIPFYGCTSFISMEIHVFHHEAIPNESLSPVRAVSRQVPPSVMALTEQWANTCLRDHRGCDVDRPASYPSRLLYIAADPIHLVITAGWPDRPFYATLSHCWGKRSFETLRLANFETFQRYVPNNAIPRTFGDAVQIARAAGISYLWIDSLCIIQDDFKDWEAEAMTMASVYGGSSLNIAASSARDGSEGCFLKPPQHAGAFTANIVISGQEHVAQFASGDEYEKTVLRSHLATRAWTVQEKLLAPRTLHCGDRGFFWECRTHIASEDLPDGFKELNADFPNKTLTMRGISRPPWRAIKEWYSRCDLSRSGDKLVALSGVARIHQEKTGDRYLAGVWRRSVVEDLCWRAIDPQERPAYYRAPSWSWAAVDGAVGNYCYHPIHRQTIYASAGPVSVMHPGKDPFGAVSYGVVSLNCDFLVRSTVLADDVGRTKRMPSPIWQRYEADEGKRGHTISFANPEKTDHVFPFFLDCVEPKDSRLGQIIYYLALSAGCFVWADRDGNEKTCEGVYGLVLEDIKELVMTESRYRRIGCFWYPKHEVSWNDSDLNPWGSILGDYRNLVKLRRGFRTKYKTGITVSIV